jgi:mono/diheme cytochrome c family protein
MSRRGAPVLLALLGLLAVVSPSPAPTSAQQPRGSGKGKATATPPGDAHAGHHGTPQDWKFAWPKGGNAAKGRELFAKLECYSCHEVRGERFPAPTDKGKVGPELSMMGPLHDEEYFAESIINPGALIEKGKGYAGPDGSSKMPSFNDTLTVQDVSDLVAYLRGLRPPGAPAPGAGGGAHGKH